MDKRATSQETVHTRKTIAIRGPVIGVVSLVTWLETAPTRNNKINMARRTVKKMIMTTEGHQKDLYSQLILVWLINDLRNIEIRTHYRDTMKTVLVKPM